MPYLNRFDNIPAFAAAAADAVARAVLNTLAKKPTVTLALPGGSIARTVIPVLVREKLPWDCLELILSDDRWVPTSHRDSNEGLVSTMLGDVVGQRLHGFYKEYMEPETALPELIANLKLPDVILLGMGEDGHVASLFPHDPANKASTPLAVVTRPDHRRVTLTPPVLSHASNLVLAMTGPSKLATIQKAILPGSADELPIRHALNAGAKLFIGP